MTRTFNTRMVFRTMGALLLLEALFMALALGVSLWYKEADNGIFLLSTIITLCAGVVGLLIGRNAESRMGEREGYVIVAMVWVVFSAFGKSNRQILGQRGFAVLGAAGNEIGHFAPSTVNLSPSRISSR